MPLRPARPVSSVPVTRRGLIIGAVAAGATAVLSACTGESVSGTLAAADGGARGAASPASTAASSASPSPSWTLSPSPSPTASPAAAALYRGYKEIVAAPGSTPTEEQQRAGLPANVVATLPARDFDAAAHERAALIARFKRLTR